MKKATMLTLTMAASLLAVAVDPATALLGNRYPQARPAVTENPMGLDGAVSWNNDSAYLFQGHQYIRYNKAMNRAEHGYPKATRHSWPGVKAP